MNARVYSIEIRAVVLFVVIAVVSIAILLLERWDDALRVSGVMAAMFIVYELIAARAYEKNRIIEDKEMLKDVVSLAAQCVAIMDMMRKMQKSSRTQDMRMALEILSTKTTLLITRYRRYVKPNTAYDIKEVEDMIVKELLSGKGKFASLESINLRIQGIPGGIRDINDPFLHRSRRRI